MNYSERALSFPCEQETLFGILAAPEKPSAIGFIVIVGGPQYRAGSHRQFVLLTRALAKAGIAALRFDYRGMGDSTGVQQDFAGVSADIGDAIDALQRHQPSISRVALWGLCDGASAALLYCHKTNDPRVGGLCLINPWVRSAASLARSNVKHYYSQRLWQKDFWIKLLSGKVAGTALVGLWGNLRLMGERPKASATPTQQQPFQQQMARAWSSFKGSILLVLSGDDYTAKEFMEYSTMDPAWAGLLGMTHVARQDLPHADHTFSNTAARSQLEAITLDWVLARVSR